MVTAVSYGGELRVRARISQCQGSEREIGQLRVQQYHKGTYICDSDSFSPSSEEIYVKVEGKMAATNGPDVQSCPFGKGSSILGICKH